MGLFKNQFILSALIFLLGAWAHQLTSRALQQDAIVAADELVMYDRYEQWRARYGRNYSDVVEMQRRFEIFKDNIQRIETFNSVNSTSYKLGVNQFSDLTNEEFRASRFGLKGLAYPATATPFEYENGTWLPRTVDWRKSGAVTPVKEQGQCGSCWAFSTVAALEAVTKISKGKLVSLSEQELVDCDSANGGCQYGWTSHAFEFMLKHGLTTEAEYPYTGRKGDCNMSKMSRPAAHSTGLGVVPSNDEKALLKAVAHQPVTVLISAMGFEFQHYKSGVFNGPCEKATNHAVTVIGYGTTQGGTKYWLLKNSWGEEWGEVGFMRIEREVADKQGLCGIAFKPFYPKM